MKVLLTRPKEDSESLAALLKARGIKSLIEPMLTIYPRTNVRLLIDDIQALIFTSANGVRSLAKATSERDLPVYAVGNTTADVARALGFKKVHSAAGDTRALADLVMDCVDPRAGTLLHAAGKRVMGDLAIQLTERGYDITCATLYDAMPAERISPTVIEAFKKKEIIAVLFFSPRTAAAFVRLASEAKLTVHCERVFALCLSPAVAREAGAIRWQELSVSTHPNIDSLLRDLDDVMNRAGK